MASLPEHRPGPQGFLAKKGDTRKFEIIANKEGLRISSDKKLAVLPVTSNTVMIDDAIDVNTDSDKVVNTDPSSGPTLVV